ncbi:MAG: tetratricopeptide repeat protein [Proteobacteria bacterium]|nr:tetratricopeptide repeat protein [Pseudomonadota bacterium]
MPHLRIVHTGGDRFMILRPRTGQTSEARPVVPPAGFPVPGRPDSDLLQELQWYLESFLDYPFPPQTDLADRVLGALRDWGRQAFTALFDSGQARDWYTEAKRDGPDRLHLHVASNDPAVLAWPWEALYDPQTGYLARTAQIERRLDRAADPRPLSDKLPRDRINVLLVTARPFERDVRYQSVSRPLVELIRTRDLPVSVHLLRPPTFDRLRDHLAERPDYYHIVHFDGHGSYGPDPRMSGEAHLFQGPQGRLVFEDEKGQPHPVEAEDLSDLLALHCVPAVVLNACQSAMIDHRASEPFASVAAALLRAGVRSVAAMAYSLYVSGAEAFLPAFYRALVETGDVARAARAGRQHMSAHPDRVCARGRYPLEDWLVPVVYQQDPMDFSFAAEAMAIDDSERRGDSEEPDIPYGFIGRDGPILEMERALRRETPAVLVHGLGGVGKTTLARGFIHWLEATEGLGHGFFWVPFQEVRSADYVFDRMGEQVFGTEFLVLDPEAKTENLVRVLREHFFLMVWDNFESVHGEPGRAGRAALPGQDLERLRGFLKRLRGGRSKVLITSRDSEDWLGEDRRRLPLPGLAGEERWAFLDRVALSLGLEVKRDDPDLIRLMDYLGGHPLAMRVILPTLETRSPGQVAESLRSSLSASDLEGDEARAHLLACLRLAEEALPLDLRPLLVPLALHERFIAIDFLAGMAEQVDEAWTRERLDRFALTLAGRGLLFGIRGSIHEIHPALTGYLRAEVLPRASETDRTAWTRAFVHVMGTVADHFAPKELHEQRFVFQVHGAGFRAALDQAESLGMDVDFRALLQALAAFAQNEFRHAEAESLYQRLAQASRKAGKKEGEAAAFHQLGQVAEERRDFDNAEAWYEKAVVVFEKLGIEHHAASTYHHLGRVAQERRDFDNAEVWYKKSLAIKEKLGNEHGAAITYHQLGYVAQERRDFDNAEAWYKKALDIEEKLGNEHGAATTYHQLGIIAEERRDFGAAEAWYKKSLDIEEKQGNEHGAAITYHQLGRVAQERRDFDNAEDWYKKAVVVFEKLGIEHHAASTYHQLGYVAEERRDFDNAEAWYKKSLDIEEKLGNEHGAAQTYGQLGRLAALREHFIESGQWLVKCIQAFTRTRDPEGVARNTRNFLILYRSAPPDVQAELDVLWTAAGLGPLPRREEDMRDAISP